MQHGARIAVGLTALVAIAHIPPQLLRRWSPFLFALNLGLLVVVLFYGSGSGAQRWLSLGLVTVQPSEFLKLTIPMLIAYILSRTLPPLPFLHILATLAAVAISAVLVAVQPDLGTALLVALIGGAVILLAGLSRHWVLSMGGLASLSLPFVWQYTLHEYQKERIRTFFNPESDPLGSGYNVIQSQIAVGSGGVSGKGWTHSTQAQFDFLPEHTTDFIFSMYAEEFGLIGVAILFALYLGMLWRLVALSEVSSGRYSQLLIGGLAVSFLLHILVNVAMTIGYAPVTG